MRRALLTSALLLGLLHGAGPGAFAQTPGEPAGESAGAPLEAPDVPAGEATLRGQVIHSDRTDSAAAGIDVVLYALSSGQQPGVRRTTTDAEGRFRFEGIAARPDVAYLLGARYAGLPFPGDRILFEAGETERVAEIRISEPTADASQVEVLQSSLRVEWLGDRLAIGEVHRLNNRASRVYHVPEGERAGRTPPLHAELPEGATGFAMPMGLVPEGALRDGRDFRFWGPLYPGQQEISFRYELPIESGLVGLEKRFPSAAGRIRVFGREGGPLEGAEGLEPKDAVEDEGQRFEPWERENAPAGFATILRLRVPESTADREAVALVESQMILEFDDVALSVKEQHQLEVPGEAAARATGNDPIVEIALPAAAEDVRFSGDAAALGLVRTDTGIGLLGPLAPGTHAVGLAYTLRNDAGSVAFSRRFDRRLPLMRVYVADSGVAVETNRLHRRRPVRDADRTYLLFEAFEVEGDELLEFSLRPLPPRAKSRTPALALALLAGVAGALFLARPLGAAVGAEDEEDAEADVTAREEREALYESIRDLEHDHETGKLEEADYEGLRRDLRARAAALLARERAAQPVADAAAGEGPAATVTCHACGAEIAATDRFCSHCGAAQAQSHSA